MDHYRNESEFNWDFSKALVKRGAMVIPLVGSGMQRAGLPDRVVHHRRWHGYLEGKVGDARPTTLQRLTLEDLLARGANAHVIRCTGRGVCQLEAPNGEVQAESVAFDELLETLEALRNTACGA